MNRNHDPLATTRQIRRSEKLGTSRKTNRKSESTRTKIERRGRQLRTTTSQCASRSFQNKTQSGSRTGMNEKERTTSPVKIMFLLLTVNDVSIHIASIR